MISEGASLRCSLRDVPDLLPHTGLGRHNPRKCAGICCCRPSSRCDSGRHPQLIERRRTEPGAIRPKSGHFHRNLPAIDALATSNDLTAARETQISRRLTRTVISLRTRRRPPIKRILSSEKQGRTSPSSALHCAGLIYPNISHHGRISNRRCHAKNFPPRLLIKSRSIGCNQV